MLSPASSHHPLHLRSVLLLILGLAVDIRPLLAQQYHTTFSLVSEVRAAKYSTGVLASDIDGDGAEDILTYGSNHSQLHLQQSSGFSWNTSTLNLGRDIVSVLSARCNKDRFGDLIVMTDSSRQALIYLGRSRGRFYLASRKIFPEPVQHLLVADVTKDRRADLLVFGEKHLGISVYPGNGNGMFREEQLLFPEYSFRTVISADFDDDGVIDFVASNWISNQLLYFRGLGKLKFSEPLVIPLMGEPSHLAIGYLNGDAATDLVVSFTDHSSLEVILADGLGGFHSAGSYNVKASATEISIADLNGDAKDDLLAFSATSRMLIVGLNDGDGIIGGGTFFSASKSPVAYALTRHSTSSERDVVLLDTSFSTLQILHSSRVGNPTPTINMYASGMNPSGVLVLDLDADGDNDVLVANEGSADVSFYRNLGNGSLDGPITFTSAIRSDHLRLVEQRADRVSVATLNSTSGEIAVLSIETNDYSHRSFSLPTIGRGHLLGSRVDNASGYITMVVLEEEGEATFSTIIEFRQISPSRFIEQVLRESLRTTSRSVALSADQLWGVYAAESSAGDSCIVYKLHLSSPLLRSPERLFAFPGGAKSNPSLWLKDITNDGLDDILVYLPEPDRLLFTAISRPDTLFNSPTFQLQGVTCQNDGNSPEFFDADGDGLTDLFVNDPMKKSLVLYLGEPGGGFQKGIPLLSTEGIYGFAVSDLNGDESPDLILSDSVRGILRIIPYEGNGR